MFNYILMMLSMVFSWTTFKKLPLSSHSLGPNSIAFDPRGGGPYTGVADGRILKFSPNTGRFQDYAFTAPNRSKKLCDGEEELSRNCGRPLGLGFYRETGELYVADAILGLVVVPSNGGQGAQLFPGADSRFLSGLDVDQRTGNVFFTDASYTYNISEFAEAVRVQDSTGHLLMYEKEYRWVIELDGWLSLPSGVAVSPNSDFVLYTEYTSSKVKKYWLTGSKARRIETLIDLTADNMRNPVSIKRDPSGEGYWIAVNFQTDPHLAPRPGAVKIDGEGNYLDGVSMSKEFHDTAIPEVHEHEGALFVGSMEKRFVGKFNKHVM